MAREFLCYLHPDGQPERWTTNVAGVRNESGKVVPACQDCASALDDASRIVPGDQITEADGVELSDVGILAYAQQGRVEEDAFDYFIDGGAVDDGTVCQIDLLRKELLLCSVGSPEPRARLKPTAAGVSLIEATEVPS